MTLLDEAIEAGGGLERWNELKRFTLQVSIGGDLLSRANRAGRFKEIVAEGCIRKQFVRLVGFASPGESGVYRPNRVTIEDPDGNVLRTLHEPRQTIRHYADQTFIDELHLVFLCGFSLWQCLMTPFILAWSGVRIEEMSPSGEQGQVWRRLKAVFPPHFVTHPHEQTFYFDAAGLQRRTDYDLFGIKVADYSSAHQEFSGIVVPTLRRLVTIKADETLVPKPSLIDVEIFDAAFE